MRIPDYTARFSQPVLGVKPGRSLLLKASVALLAVIGIPAVCVLIWAEATGFNLNHLPLLPRLALAAGAVAGAVGIATSVEERQAETILSCYKDRLTLDTPACPALWRQGDRPRLVEVRYADVKQCICSGARMKVSLYTKGYTLTEGERTARKTGAVHFSTLGATGTDFAALLEKHTSLKVLRK